MKKKLSVILCAALVLSALCAALLTACNDKPNEPAVYTLDPDRDFGLYWYNDEGEIMLSEADMPVEFYDPEKPTVVYSHGWKMNPVPEALVTQQSTVESTGGLSGERDYAEELRAAGYNVGYFDWHLYAADLTYLDDEIWTVATETPDNDSNYAAAVKALNGHSFAGEFAREIATVMKNAVNTHLHFVGHSYGGQMVTAAAHTLAKMYDQGLVANPACVPDRVSLADPYIPSEALGGYTKGTLDIIGESYDAPLAQVTANAIAYLNSRGTFVDLYGGMSFIYENYANTLPDLKDTIKANTAYISLDGLLGDMTTKHVNARDYVLTNLVDGIAGNITSLPFTVAVSAEDGRAFVGKAYTQKGPGFDWATTSYIEVTD